MSYMPDPWRHYRRTIEDLQRTVNPVGGLHTQDSVRRAIQQLSGGLTAESVRRVSEQVSANREIQRAAERMVGYSRPAVRRALEQAAFSFPPNRLQGLADQIAGTYSPLNLRISEQVVRSYQTGFHGYRRAADMAAAAQRFEAEAEEAGDLPEESDDKSLGWWLATRPLIVQVGLMYAGLQVLDAFSKLLEEASGDDIPDALQAATQVCFAVIAFMLVWMSERDGTGD